MDDKIVIESKQFDSQQWVDNMIRNYHGKPEMVLLQEDYRKFKQLMLLLVQGRRLYAGCVISIMDFLIEIRTKMRAIEWYHLTSFIMHTVDARGIFGVTHTTQKFLELRAKIIVGKLYQYEEEVLNGRQKETNSR